MPCTLHSTTQTPHSSLYTPISTLHTLHSPIPIPNSTLFTPHFALPKPHSPLHSLHSPQATPHSTPRIPHFALHTLHSSIPCLFTPHLTLPTLHAPHLTLYTRHSTHFTLYTLHSTLQALHTLESPPYIPHSTLHTSHSTLYTPHSPLNTPPLKLYTSNLPHCTPPIPHTTVYSGTVTGEECTGLLKWTWCLHNVRFCGNLFRKSVLRRNFTRLLFGSLVGFVCSKCASEWNTNELNVAFASECLTYRRIFHEFPKQLRAKFGEQNVGRGFASSAKKRIDSSAGQCYLKTLFQRIRKVVKVTSRRCSNVFATSCKWRHEDFRTYQEHFASYLVKILHRIRNVLHIIVPPSNKASIGPINFKCLLQSFPSPN